MSLEEGGGEEIETADPLGARLKTFVLSRARSVRAYAAKLPVGESLLRRYIAGTVRPGVDFLEKVHADGCNLNWLVDGTGDMIREVVTDSPELGGFRLVDVRIPDDMTEIVPHIQKLIDAMAGRDRSGRPPEEPSEADQKQSPRQ